MESRTGRTVVKHQILVADDEEIVRESIRDWLEYAGFTVITAKSGEEAVEIVGKCNFSLLIIDYRLPGKNGIAVLNELKARKTLIKSIIITAFPSAEMLNQALKLGVIECLTKPLTLGYLEELIRRSLSKCEVELLGIDAQYRANPDILEPAEDP